MSSLNCEPFCCVAATASFALLTECFLLFAAQTRSQAFAHEAFVSISNTENCSRLESL